MILAFAALAVAPSVLTSSVATAGPASACENADAGPREVSTGKLRKAIDCLIAEQRAAYSRKRVRPNRALKGVAKRHNAVMLKRNCFSQQCRGEPSVGKRIESSRYVGPGDRYGFGQNVGYAETPAAMIKSWMGSSFHRRNILRKRFRHVGIAAGRGAPVADRPDRRFATYTVLFAWRKR